MLALKAQAIIASCYAASSKVYMKSDMHKRKKERETIKYYIILSLFDFVEGLGIRVHMHNIHHLWHYSSQAKSDASSKMQCYSAILAASQLYKQLYKIKGFFCGRSDVKITYPSSTDPIPAGAFMPLCVCLTFSTQKLCLY